MTEARLLEHFDRVSEAPEAVLRVRQFILELAVRGKLVDQDSTDECAEAVLDRIAREKAKLTKAGEIAPPSSSVRRMAPDAVGPVPPGWKSALLHEVLLELQTGPFGSSLHQSDYAAGGTPVINPASIRNERLVPIDKMAVGNATLERLSAFKLRVNDIVMARRGEMGRCAVVSDREAGWLCGTGSLILRPSQHISARFLMMLIGSPQGREYLSYFSVGTTMRNLNQGILAGMPLAVPPTREQQRIVERVDELMALCDQLEAAQAERDTRRNRVVAASLQRLKEPAEALQFREDVQFYLSHLPLHTTRVEQIKALRQAILSLAVRGRLVAQVPDDERPQSPKSTSSGDETPFEIPANWIWSPLAALGHMKGGGTPSKGKEEFWNGTIPWVSPKDMKRDYIDSAQMSITELAVNDSAATMIPAGSILFVVRGMILAHSFPAAIATVPLTINQDMKASVDTQNRQLVDT